MIGLNHYLIVAALMFVVGAFGMLRRKNLLMLFFSTEILLSSVNVGLVAVGYYLGALIDNFFQFLFLPVVASEAQVGLGFFFVWLKNILPQVYVVLQLLKG